MIEKKYESKQGQRQRQKERERGTNSISLISNFFSILFWLFINALPWREHLNKSSVQFNCSVVSGSATPWITACQASLSITNSWSSLKLYLEYISIQPLYFHWKYLICILYFLVCISSRTMLASHTMADNF